MLNLRGSTRPIILNDFEPFNVEDEWECYGDIVRVKEPSQPNSLSC
jgi:hypothetical protein